MEKKKRRKFFCSECGAVMVLNVSSTEFDNDTGKGYETFRCPNEPRPRFMDIFFEPPTHYRLDARGRTIGTACF